MKPPIHAIYSSNDSGFSNEIPPAPEVDYSDDDDMPKKIPIRFVTALKIHIMPQLCNYLVVIACNYYLFMI